MNKYNTEEYFSVINKNTGKKIADCAEWSDAMMMLDFDPQNRTITRNKFLMSQVIDIEMPKALPTSEIVVAHNSNSEKFDEYLLEPKQMKLPEGQQEPVKI